VYEEKGSRFHVSPFRGEIMKYSKKVTLTEFELAVLKATLEIPFGETRSYAWVARRIGQPRAVRAVGSALRKNPWPLIIPCHRVIKSDGNPGKYAGRDTGRKRKLIDLERQIKAII
jgi:O-6-methylguanine DNA methyltransferase